MKRPDAGAGPFENNILPHNTQTMPMRITVATAIDAGAVTARTVGPRSSQPVVRRASTEPKAEQPGQGRGPSGRFASVIDSAVRRKREKRHQKERMDELTRLFPPGPLGNRAKVLVEAILADEHALALHDRWRSRNPDKVVASKTGIPGAAVAERHRIAMRLVRTHRSLEKERRSAERSAAEIREIWKRLGLSDEDLNELVNDE